LRTVGISWNAWYSGAGFDAQHVARDLLHALGNGKAMHRRVARVLHFRTTL